MVNDFNPFDSLEENSEKDLQFVRKLLSQKLRDRLLLLVLLEVQVALDESEEPW